MAHPFGDIPTFGKFKAWASQEGFAVVNGIMEINNRSVKVTRFEKDGVAVPVAGILDGEHLVPTTVNYLERRLGVKSPFPSFGPSNSGAYG